MAAELQKSVVSTIKTAVGTEIKVVKADIENTVKEVSYTPVYTSINANVLPLS